MKSMNNNDDSTVLVMDYILGSISHLEQPQINTCLQ